jgi:ribonuclease E
LAAAAPLSEELAAVHDAPPTFVDSQAEAGLPPTGDTPAGEERQGRGRRRRRGGRDRADEQGTTVGDEATAEGATEAPAEAATDAATAVVADAAPAAEGDDAAEGQGRESRRRGGRGRNRNRREEGAAEGQEAAAGEDAVSTASAPDSAPVQGSLIESAMAGSAAPVQAPAPVTVVAPPPPAPAPVVEAFKLPLGELQAIAEGAGLQWVNSDADKIAAVQAAIAAEPAPAPLGREPAPVVVVDEGPLVLVETRKDLSQVKLPFEA